MGTAAFYLRNSQNIKIIGGSSRGFDNAVIAENCHDLTVDSHEMMTTNGVDAQDCTKLNLSRNHHYPNYNPPITYKTQKRQECSVFMFYAHIYLNAHNYNPFI